MNKKNRLLTYILTLGLLFNTVAPPLTIYSEGYNMMYPDQWIYRIEDYRNKATGTFTAKIRGDKLITLDHSARTVTQKWDLLWVGDIDSNTSQEISQKFDPRTDKFVGQLRHKGSHIAIGDRTKQVSNQSSSTYEDDDWYGTGLSQYVASGSEAASKYISEHTSSNYSDSQGYRGSLSSFVKSGLPADSKYVTDQSSSYYNSGGYSGTLTRYVKSGSYTPPDTKYISDHSSANYNSGGYSGTLQRYVKSGHPSGSKYVTNQSSAGYSDSEGYRGILTQYVYSGQEPVRTNTNGIPYNNWRPSPNATCYATSPRYNGNIIFSCPEIDSNIRNCDIISHTDLDEYTVKTEPYTKDLLLRSRQGDRWNITYKFYWYNGYCQTNDTRVYKYKGTVTRPDTQVYSYRGNVTKPGSDTRVWRYQGTVHRPDTQVIRYRGTVNKPDTRVYRYRGTVRNKVYEHEIHGRYLKRSDLVFDWPVNVWWEGVVNPRLTDFNAFRVNVQDPKPPKEEFNINIVDSPLNSNTLLTTEYWSLKTHGIIPNYRPYPTDETYNPHFTLNVKSVTSPLIKCKNTNRYDTIPDPDIIGGELEAHDHSFKLECEPTYDEFVRLNIDKGLVNFKRNEIKFKIDHDFRSQDRTMQNTSDNQAAIDKQTFVTKDEGRNKFNIATSVELPPDIEYEYDESQEPVFSEEPGSTRLKKIYTYTLRLNGQPENSDKIYNIENDFFPYDTNVVLKGSDGVTTIELPLRKGTHDYTFNVPNKNSNGRLITYTIELDGTLYRIVPKGTEPNKYKVEVANDQIQVVLQNNNPATVLPAANDIRIVNLQYDPLAINQQVTNFGQSQNITQVQFNSQTELISDQRVTVESPAYNTKYPFAKWNEETVTDVSQMKNNKFIIKVKQDEFVDNVDLKWKIQFKLADHPNIQNKNAFDNIFLFMFNETNWLYQKENRPYTTFDNVLPGRIVEMTTKLDYDGSTVITRFSNEQPNTDGVLNAPGISIAPRADITHTFNRASNTYTSLSTHNVNEEGEMKLFYKVIFNLRENDKYVLNHVPASRIVFVAHEGQPPTDVEEYKTFDQVKIENATGQETYEAILMYKPLKLNPDANIYAYILFNDDKYTPRFVLEPIISNTSLNTPLSNRTKPVIIKTNYNSGNGTFTGIVNWIGKAYKASQTLTAKMDGIIIGTKQLDPTITNYTFTDIPVMNNDGNIAVYSVETTQIPRTTTTIQNKFNITNRYNGRIESMFVPVAFPNNTNIKPFFVKLGDQVLPVTPEDYATRPKTEEILVKTLEFTNVRFDNDNGEILSHIPQVSYNATGPWSASLENNGTYQDPLSFFSVTATPTEKIADAECPVYNATNTNLCGNNGTFSGPKVNITYNPTKVEIGGDITWTNGNPTKRPRLVLQLKVGTEVKEELEVNNQATEYKFANTYPVKDKFGEVIPYSVEQKPDTVDTRYTYTSNNVTKQHTELGVIPKFDISLNYLIPKISVTKNINWKDGIQDTNLKVTFNLLRNGSKVAHQEIAYPTTTHTFIDLDKTDLQENVYDYTIQIETDDEHTVVDQDDGSSTIQYVPPKGNLTFKTEIDGGHLLLTDTGFELWTKYVVKSATGDTNVDEKVDNIVLTKETQHNAYLDVTKNLEFFTIQGLRKEFYIKSPTQHELFEQTFKNKDTERTYIKRMKFLNDKTQVEWKTQFNKGEILNITPKYKVKYDTYESDLTASPKPNSYQNFDQALFTHRVNDLVKYNADGSTINWLNNISAIEVPDNWTVSQNNDIFLWQYNVPLGTIKFKVQVNAETKLQLLERVSEKETKVTGFVDEVKFGDPEAVFNDVPLTYDDGTPIKYELALTEPERFDMFHDKNADIYTIQLKPKPITNNIKDYKEQDIIVKVIWDIKGSKSPIPVRIVSDPYQTDYYNFGNTSNKEETYTFNKVKVSKDYFRLDWVQPDKYKVAIIDKVTIKITDKEKVNKDSTKPKKSSEPFVHHATEEPESEGYYYDTQENDESTLLDRSNVLIIGEDPPVNEIQEDPKETEIFTNLEEERAYLNIPPVVNINEKDISVKSNILGSSKNFEEPKISDTSNEKEITSQKSTSKKAATVVNNKPIINNNTTKIYNKKESVQLNPEAIEVERNQPLQLKSDKTNKEMTLAANIDSNEIETDKEINTLNGAEFNNVKETKVKSFNWFILLILFIVIVISSLLVYRFIKNH